MRFSSLGWMLRVHPLQLLPQGGQALVLHPALEGLAQAAVRLEGGKPASGHQVVDIQSRPPRHDGQAAPGQKPVYNGHGLLNVPGHGVVLLRVGHVDHVVGDAQGLRWGGLGGADVHPPVDLHGVGGHHLSPQPQGQLRRQCGLAGGRGPADH